MLLFGIVIGDIVYGGVFYFYVDGVLFDLLVCELVVEKLICFGVEVKVVVNVKYLVVYLEILEINYIYGMIIVNVLCYVGLM